MSETPHDVRALDAFLIPPCGFGVVLRVVGAVCFVRMQNGAEGLMTASAVAPLKVALHRQSQWADA